MDYDLWTTDNGLMTTDFGLCIKDFGLRTLDYRFWNLDCVLWTGGRGHVKCVIVGTPSFCSNYSMSTDLVTICEASLKFYKTPRNKDFLFFR